MSSQAINSTRLIPVASVWINSVVVHAIRLAASRAPRPLTERLEEEWLADLAERSGQWSRLSFALGCCWAAAMITHEHGAVGLAAASVPALPTAAASGPSRARRMQAPWHPSTSAAAICDINTTPLIDVMLVLLVTLIITLPVMTHAVTLTLPQAPAREEVPTEVVDLEIDPDGTVVWNGSALASLQQLEDYFRVEAQKSPQPEIHLRPDRRARYDVVARVLASAQHSRLKRIGFVNTGQFDE